MCKNTIQFQKGLGIMQFLANYGSEEQCENALSSWRWPDGFQCPKCGSRSFCKLHRKAEFQCNCCRCQTSLTSNTIFDSTKLPLATWFLGIYLVTQNKAGISCLTLHRQLGISYNAALRMKHKLMQVMMERDNSWQLSVLFRLMTPIGAESATEAAGAEAQRTKPPSWPQFRQMLITTLSSSRPKTQPIENCRFYPEKLSGALLLSGD
ncbi:transposase [Endozoicomonas sp. SCSIO W0465]|uniref:transposase n=1 Tax=Endozoicomonas sp. SCSIO W0465 TaxID=2918516 RepID=UPI003531E65D